MIFNMSVRKFVARNTRIRNPMRLDTFPGAYDILLEILSVSLWTIGARQEVILSTYESKVTALFQTSKLFFQRNLFIKR